LWYCHNIYDELDFEHHVDYIHYNPVKHDYVNKPSDWKNSSFHRDVEQGTIPINCCASDIYFSDGIENVGKCRVTAQANPTYCYYFGNVGLHCGAS